MLSKIFAEACILCRTVMSTCYFRKMFWSLEGSYTILYRVCCKSKISTILYTAKRHSQSPVLLGVPWLVHALRGLCYVVAVLSGINSSKHVVTIVNKVGMDNHMR